MRELRLAVSDKRLRRLFLVFELAAVATLLNPYGLRLYAAVFSVIAFSAITVGLLEQAETKFFRPDKKVGR